MSKAAKKAANCIVDPRACGNDRAKTTGEPKIKKIDPGSKQSRVIALLSISRRHHNRRNDEGNGLAAAFSARLPGRSGAQKAQAEAQLQEDRRHPGLSHR